jgi:hypothetical protein
MSDEKETRKQNIKLQAAIAILIGLLGISLSAYLGESIKPTAPGLLSAFLTGYSTLSIALVGFAIFSMLLDSHNWREYFSDRLKEIVLEKEYLKTLDTGTLRQLQTSVLKALFKNPDIDKEGGFLRFFENNLHKYISEPYREDASTEIILKKVLDSGFLFLDKVSYVCRSSGGEIQKHVGYKPDDGEFEEVQFVKISVQYPQYHAKAGEIVVLYEKKDAELQGDLDIGIDASLIEYQGIDGLVVTIESKYIVAKGKFQYWQMAHPTKNFDITIKFPEELGIQFKTLVIEDVVGQVTNEDGYLKFKYDYWLLPQSGLAWLIGDKCLTSQGSRTAEQLAA